MHDAHTAEDLVLRDAVRYIENFGVTPVITSSVHRSKGYTGSTSLQPPQIDGENYGICERRASYNTKEVLVDTRSVISSVSYIYAVVPSFLAKG